MALLSLVVAPVRGQWTSTSGSRHAVVEYGAETGLPGVVVHHAVQTTDGYVWVGTPSGLARFDGVRFQVYRAGAAAALASDNIQCLVPGREGDLWIGTTAGVVRHRGGIFEAVGPNGVAARALAMDRDGKLWIGTAGQGVHVWDRGRLVPFSDPLVPANSAVRAMLCDSAGRVWIARDRAAGVLCWDGQRLTDVRSEDGLLSEVIAIAEQPAGTLWFGTQRQGLFRWHGGRTEQFAVRETGARAVTDLRPARDGALWVAAGVLLRVANPEKPELARVPGVPHDSVRSVHEDREGGLWLSAGAEGLVRIQPTHHRAIAVADGLPSNNVKTVSADPAGNLWLGIQHHGVMQISPNGHAKLHREADGLPSIDPAIVYAGRDGRVWVGISSRLFVREQGEWRRFGDVRFVRGLHEDRAGGLWIGTESRGLFRLEGESLRAVALSSGQPVPLATAFAESPDGTLYIGTWRKGLFRHRAGEVVALEGPEGPPSSEVRAVHVDAEGNLWVGMRERGLALWHEGRWFNPDELAAAVAHHVSAIASDEFGRLWLGTTAGVAWMSRQELIAAAERGGPLPLVHPVTTSPETRDAPIWSGGQPVVWRTATGELLFATRRGVLTIDPRNVTINNVVPPVYIERALVDRTPVDHATGLKLAPGTRALTVEFTAPSFVEPRRVRFKYRLEGFDSEWQDGETRRSVSYTRLPPGKYTFRVTACNNDGVWNPTGAALAVVQQPYFHQTRAFYGLLAAVVAAGGWGIYRLAHRRLRSRVQRLEHEQAMEHERRRIAQDLHDDLGASLTEIGLYAQTASDTANPTTRGDLDFLAQRSRGLVRSLDAIVWAVNPSNDWLDDLASYLAEFFQELFRRSPISPRLEVAPGIPHWPVTAEQRSHVFLAAKEAMNNVLKHSGASEVLLRIAMAGEALNVTIQDNGGGFAPAAATAAGGNGLSNMRSRIERSGGVIQIVSQPGLGTTVTIIVCFTRPAGLPKS